MGCFCASVLYVLHVCNNPQSDLPFMLKAVGAFEYAGGEMEFCDKNLLRYKVRFFVYVFMCVCTCVFCVHLCT